MASETAKMASKSDKIALYGLHDGPKTPPKQLRCPQESPRWSPDASKAAQDGPKTASRLPKRPQRRSKLFQEDLQEAPRKPESMDSPPDRFGLLEF